MSFLGPYLTLEFVGIFGILALSKMENRTSLEDSQVNFAKKCGFCGIRFYRDKSNRRIRENSGFLKRKTVTVLPPEQLYNSNKAFLKYFSKKNFKFKLDTF